MSFHCCGAYEKFYEATKGAFDIDVPNCVCGRYFGSHLIVHPHRCPDHLDNFTTITLDKAFVELVAIELDPR